MRLKRALCVWGKSFWRSAGEQPRGDPSLTHAGFEGVTKKEFQLLSPLQTTRSASAMSLRGGPLPEGAAERGQRVPRQGWGMLPAFSSAEPRAGRRSGAARTGCSHGTGARREAPTSVLPVRFGSPGASLSSGVQHSTPHICSSEGRHGLAPCLARRYFTSWSPAAAPQPGEKGGAGGNFSFSTAPC